MGKKVDIEKLISQMTLEEKLGQLTQLVPSFFRAERGEITGPMQELGLGSDDINKIGSVLGTIRAEDALEIQKKYLGENRLGIPLIFMRDVIHGFRTIYPIPLGLGCSFDTELVSECVRMAAEEASAGGIQLTFAPMIDYTRDARWGRILETNSEDPYLNSVFGAASVRAYQGDDISKPGNIASCVKHFAAYGGAEAGRDYNSVEISEHSLREFYFPAYKACVDAGVKMLMPAFNNLNGVPCTANKWLMKDILRDEWGYDGVVISDWGAVAELVDHGVAENLKDAAELAFDCGCDIEMMTSSYYKNMKALIEEGRFTEKQIDDAVRKVLKLKCELGLFDDPHHGASEEKEKELYLCDKHREIARRAAEESAVLLKNNGVLPFAKSVKKIALIGPYANCKSILGQWAGSGDINDSVTIYEGITALLPDAEITIVTGCGMEFTDTDRSGFDDAVNAARAADIAILCLGEPDDYSGEGNCRTDLTLPGVQTELARAVTEANPDTAVVLFNGRPIVITELSEFAPAILEMWFPGTEGGNAVANLLFGDANPCGKLSSSFPKSTGQCPIYYNYCSTGRPKKKPDGVREPYMSNYIDCGNLPLYFFGEGLSYTEFSYESMKLDKHEMTADDKITVSVTVRNIGKRAGKETVQLYLRDLVSSTVRPIQELCAFEKITLSPGEAKTVSFEIGEEKLRLWNARNEFVSEPGDFTISVGYANHMYFEEKFTLKEKR